MTGLDLGEEHEGGRPGDMCSGSRVGPTAAVGTVGDRIADDAVIGRMELHRVDPVAPPVMTGEDRRIGVRQLGVPLEIGPADKGADCRQLAAGPSGAEPGNGLGERRIGGELIDLRTRRSLVEHLVRRHIRIVQIQG